MPGRERSHVTQDIDIKALIRTVPDFPKPGILFRDITTLLKHADGFHAVVEQLGAAYRGRAIDKIAAIESRGFIVGAALAYTLNVGFVPIRKQGKLPAENFGHDYHLDLIATGGTAEAALTLIGIAGGSVVGCAFVIDLPDLGGRERIERLGYSVLALCQFPGH